MIAEVLVADELPRRAAHRMMGQLFTDGWKINEIQHYELATSASPHDSRLGDLNRKAIRGGIATFYSIYG